jgi:hypothetical protein
MVFVVAILILFALHVPLKHERTTRYVKWHALVMYHKWTERYEVTTLT